jgi:hypothetical protein
MVRLAFDVQDPVEAGGQRLQGLRKGHDAHVIGRVPLMLTRFGRQPRLFLLFRSLFRLGCTRFGSPGIFG